MPVDREWGVFLSRRDADLELRNQAPALACQHVEMPVVIVIGRIGLPETRTVAIGAPRIGCDGGAEKIRFDIGRQVLRRIDVARGQKREAALASTAAEFLLVVEGR